jgi:hypothetical protein
MRDPGTVVGGGAGGTGSAHGDAGSGNAGAGAGAAGTDNFGNSGMMTSMMHGSQQPMVNPDACQSTGQTAMTGIAAVDIVWVIDGSGSMSDEAERLQMNIDNFTSTISASGVDTHVVLVGQKDLVPANSMLAQSGKYLFVQDDVDSWNAFERLVARFPDYKSFLRPSAHVHFIVVTDDESRYMNLQTPDERAMGFQTAMDGLLDSEFTVHAIASPGNEGDLPCIPDSVDPAIAKCCQDYIASLFLTFPMGCDMDKVTILTCPFLGGAAAPGVTYQREVTNTGGVFASICSEDWTQVFGSLSDAVIASAPLPCDYAIPPPPTGMSFDRTKVNVKYTPQGADPASVQPYGKVKDADACGDEDGWYFDDDTNPTKVMLCPTTCAAVGGGEGGAVDVLFGCATVVVL